MKHEILEEVWRVRDKISAECGYDLKRLVQRLRALEAGHPERLASLAPPKPGKPALTLREDSPPYQADSSGGKP